MDFDNNSPIYIQVIQQIKKDLVIGKLKAGEKMPSTREFAAMIVLNINTVSRIYKELEREEIVFTKRGLGTFVTTSEDKIQEMKEEMAQGFMDDFINGMESIGYGKEEMLTMLSEMEHKNLQ